MIPRMGVSRGVGGRAGFSYMIMIKQMDEFAKNKRAKRDEFTLLVGDLVYTPYPCIFPLGSYAWLKAKLNFFEVNIGTKINLNKW